MNVSFDFDGTLHRDGKPLWPAVALLHRHHRAGHRVMIATTRTEAHERPAWWRVHEPNRILIHKFVARYRLPVSRIAFTANQPKVATLVRYRIHLHYDNDPAEALAAVGANVHVIILKGVAFHACNERSIAHYCRR